MMETSDKTFPEDLRHAGSVAVVVFWAEWARGRRELHDFHARAVDRLGALPVLAVNTDANPVTTHAYDVHRVPTVAIITADGVAWRTEGALDVDAFEHAWRAAHADPSGPDSGA